MTQARYEFAPLVTLLTTPLQMAPDGSQYLPHFWELLALAVKNMNSRSVVTRYRPFSDYPSFADA